ncbi:hypothetical protein Tco_1429845 [Tanacetum coccineum]
MVVASSLQKNKHVESLKTTSLPFPELCAPLFVGTLSSGVKSHGPSSTEPRRVVEPHMVEDYEHIEVIANKINQPGPPLTSPPSVEDCENKLNDLGWDENDPLYEIALAIFCDPNDHYREGWMKLKPQRCVNLVKMIGRGKGFM